MNKLTETFINLRKEDLETRRKEIMEDLRSFAHKNPEIPDDWETNFPSLGNDEDENAREVTTYVNELPVEYTLEVELKKINGALLRIQNDAYGTCNQCNGLIDAKRLEAHPEAESCINCAT